MKKANLERPVPELAELKQPAVVNHIDILRNPVFRVDDRRLVKDGQQSDITFEVNGRVRVRVEKAELTSVEGQVLPALLTYAAKERFRSNRVEFILADFLRFMGWQTGGSEYLRLARAIRNLYEAEVTIYQPSKRRWVKTRFIHTYSFPDIDGTSAILFRRSGHEKDFVEFTTEFCRLWHAEIPEGKANFKALHPGYFSLTTRIQQRLVEIISVYASDLSEWEPSLFWLRDTIPLHGETYRFPSAVKRALDKPLKNLVQRGFIKAYEWHKKQQSTEWKLWLKLNSEYYYSAQQSHDRASTKSAAAGTKRRTESPDLSESQQFLLDELLKRRVSPLEARRFVTERDPVFLERKLDHLDFEIERGNAKNPGAFLAAAIRGEWTAPDGFDEWRAGKEERRQKQAEAIDEIRAKAQQGSVIEAVRLGEEASRLGPSSELEDILADLRPKAQREVEAQEKRYAEIEKRVDELMVDATEDDWHQAIENVSKRSNFERKQVNDRGKNAVLVKVELRAILRKRVEAERC